MQTVQQMEQDLLMQALGLRPESAGIRVPVQPAQRISKEELKGVCANIMLSFRVY